MKISRSRRVHVQTSKYEWIEFGADIEFDHPVEERGLEGSATFADETLTTLLAPEVEAAASEASPDSFILTYRYTETS